MGFPQGFDGRCAGCGSPYAFGNAKSLGVKDWNCFCSNLCIERSAPLMPGTRESGLLSEFIEIVDQLIACHDEPDCPAVAVARDLLHRAGSKPSGSGPR